MVQLVNFSTDNLISAIRDFIVSVQKGMESSSPLYTPEGAKTLRDNAEEIIQRLKKGEGASDYLNHLSDTDPDAFCIFMDEVLIKLGCESLGADGFHHQDVEAFWKAMK
jgi:hypothetical protein